MDVSAERFLSVVDAEEPAAKAARADIAEIVRKNLQASARQCPPLPSPVPARSRPPGVK